MVFNDTGRHLKNRILAQDQGGTEFQPADILKYFEELKRGLKRACPVVAIAKMENWDKRHF